MEKNFLPASRSYIIMVRSVVDFPEPVSPAMIVNPGLRYTAFSSTSI